MPERVQVRCLVCGDQLSYEKDCTDPLIEHLQVKHPFVTVAHSTMNESRSSNALQSISAHNIKSPEHNQETSELENQYEDSELLKSTKSFGDHICGPGKVFCLSCKQLNQTVIKKQKRYIGSDTIGACFMLGYGCWPICFFPFLMHGNRIVNVYCSKCETFLGSYDQKLNILMTRPVSSFSHHSLSKQGSHPSLTDG